MTGAGTVAGRGHEIASSFDGGCCACGARAFCPRARLSGSSGEDRRANRAVGQLRHRGPADRRSVEPSAQADLRRGKPSGRRDHRRHQGSDCGRTGWLHAAGRRLEQHRIQRRPLQEPVLRSAEGPRSGRARSQHFLHARGLAQLSAHDAEGHHRRGQGQSRRHQARQRRCRYGPACCRRRVPGHHRHENAGRAVSRIGAGVSRLAVRTRRSVL